MRRPLAALAAAALLTAACGSTVQLKGQVTTSGDGLGTVQQQGGDLGGTTGTTTPGGTTGTTGTGGATGSTGGLGSTGLAQGTSGSGAARTPVVTQGSTAVAGDHDPVKIGFVTTSVGNAEALGLNAGQSYTDKAMLQALVDEYNASGGVAGHKIVPVYGATDTSSSNWANQFAAVCATFTQDNHVQAVIGYVFVFLHNFEDCLAKAGVPHLYGGYQPGDRVDQQQYPYLVGTGHPTTDGAILTPLAGALKTGLLNGRTKLGLLLDGCADGDRAYARSVQPWLKAHGISYETESISCAQGATDVSSASAAVSSAELKFASKGVNLVYGAGVELLVFMQDAESQGYKPEYLSGVGGAALEANASASVLQRFHGIGWMPSVDVDPGHQPYPQTAGQKACIAKLQKHGLRPSQYNDFMAAYQACDGLDLYAKALAATGTTAAGPVVQAVKAAMPAFAGRGTYGGAMMADGEQHGGPGRARAYGWNAGCSCLLYSGPLLPITTS